MRHRNGKGRQCRVSGNPAKGRGRVGHLQSRLQRLSCRQPLRRENTHITLHLHPCFPCSSLFELCLAAWNQGLIHDLLSLAPCGEGEAENNPVKCQMFLKGIQAMEGIGGERGNSLGAGSLEIKDKRLQNTLFNDKTEWSQTYLCGPQQVTSPAQASISSVLEGPFQHQSKDSEAVYESHFES